MDASWNDAKQDSGEVSDHEDCRRYFGKFERIIGHLHRIAVDEVGPASDGSSEKLVQLEVEVVEGYLACLANSLTALSTKYLLTGIVSNKLPAKLEIDRAESGFPVFRELLQMANDLVQADRHLESLPSQERLKSEIVDQILQSRTIPRDLQFALSQRIYYEILRDKPLFLAQSDPQLVWLGKVAGQPRRYLIHWAVYDSQTNLPIIYIMGIEESGEGALNLDERRWSRAQEHLLAQSLSSLKLLTIATGFDKDFEDIHPKYLKRILLGPMYSNTFTRQHDSLRAILADAEGTPGQDWLFVWTTETLLSKSTKRTRSGLFGEVMQEIYELDHIDADLFDSGATRIERSIILPDRPYQTLVDREPAALKGVKRYVVGQDGTVLSGA